MQQQMEEKRDKPNPREQQIKKQELLFKLKKQELLFKLQRMEKRGMPLSQHFSMQSEFDDIEMEFNRLKSQRDPASSSEAERPVKAGRPRASPPVGPASSGEAQRPVKGGRPRATPPVGPASSGEAQRLVNGGRPRATPPVGPASNSRSTPSAKPSNAVFAREAQMLKKLQEFCSKQESAFEQALPACVIDPTMFFGSEAVTVWHSCVGCAEHCGENGRDCGRSNHTTIIASGQRHASFYCPAWYGPTECALPPKPSRVSPLSKQSWLAKPGGNRNRGKVKAKLPLSEKARSSE